MNKLKGVNPPAVTIFDADGHVDYRAMKLHTDFMIEGGVDGIAYLGTSGEFSVMTLEEKLRMIEIMTSYVNHRVHVSIGIGDTCLDNTLKMLKAAENAGADAVLAVAPYFSVYAEENIEAYYRELDRYSSLPIILYNFPAITGFDLSPQLVERLILTCKNIRGIKDTVPETEHLTEMLKLKQHRDDFAVFCAYETQALQMIHEGVDGFINATANFAPELTAGFYRAALNDNSELEKLYFDKMCEAAKVYQYSVPLLLAVKEAVYQRVLHYSGKEILPGLSLSQEKKNEIKTIIHCL